LVIYVTAGLNRPADHLDNTSAPVVVNVSLTTPMQIYDIAMAPDLRAGSRKEKPTV
jgi:hypothetical protein